VIVKNNGNNIHKKLGLFGRTRIQLKIYIKLSLHIMLYKINRHMANAYKI